MYGKKIIGLGGFNRTKKEARNLSKDIDLIFKHTMKDYRSNSEGIPKVLYFDKNKGTILSPIEKLPKKIFYERLKYAKQKEKTKGLGGIKPIFTLKFINSEIKRIKPIMKKYQVIAKKDLSYYKDLMTIQKYYLMLQSEKNKLSKK